MLRQCSVQYFVKILKPQTELSMFEARSSRFWDTLYYVLRYEMNICTKLMLMSYVNLLVLLLQRVLLTLRS